MKKSASQELKRRLIILAIFLGILFGGIFAYKAFVGIMMGRALASQSHVVTVSSMKAEKSSWPSEIAAVGSLRAIRGVNISSELAGTVRDIYFTPGSFVDADTILLELNIDPDIAQLHALQATAELNQITYNRDEAQYGYKAISKATLDTDAANLKNSLAQVDQQVATIAKKVIRAPFKGRLGISTISPGQYLNPGDPIVTIQQLDPIYVDFYLPQQQITRLSINQTVTLASDALPGKTFTGKITTINPIVDSSTRNVEVEATIDNPNLELVPGIFANITVSTGQAQNYITLPQTAVVYNPYGNMVFRITADTSDPKSLSVKQVFVQTGDTRGDQVMVLSGLNPGDEIVTSGQLKLKNGSLVQINNAIQPSNNPNPVLTNDHEG